MTFVKVLISSVKTTVGEFYEGKRPKIVPKMVILLPTSPLHVELRSILLKRSIIRSETFYTCAVIYLKGWT